MPYLLMMSSACLDSASSLENFRCLFTILPVDLLVPFGNGTQTLVQTLFLME